MLWRLALGGAVGAGLSALSSTSTTIAVTVPTLDSIIDPSKDMVPLQAVIIGGGYSGSKLAYMFDSVFQMTLVDEKNFFELTNDIIPIIATPWGDKHTEACRRLLVLHRYYLRRANVLTGTVDGVSADKVFLSDGRSINYDILFVTPGERKPFPFSTTQRTINGRVAELREFNQFLGTCKKVAIVGGGPVGTSLAEDLAKGRPQMTIDLYHSKSELIPALPKAGRAYTRSVLEKNANLNLHLSSRVAAIEGVNSDGAVVVTKQNCKRRFWRWLTWWSPVAVPATYRLTVEKLHFTPEPQQSILSQVYFGKRPPHLSSDQVENVNTVDGYDYVFVLSGDTPRPIPRGSGKENILEAHQMPSGHYRVSTLMQFYGLPHILAPGRCNNLPLVKGYGCSDIQVRTLFRMLNSVVNSPMERLLGSDDGVQLRRMQIPHLLVRLGEADAVGCTPWSGCMMGVAAMHEFMQDRNHLVKEYQSPVFYKQQDPVKVKKRMSVWKTEEITDIVDFSHC